MNTAFVRRASRGWSLAMSLTFALSPAIVSASPATPRAWLVAKGDAQAVLVGESHLPTPVESDSYYDTVVQPSYAVADTAVMETYFGPEQMRNEAFERGAPCPGDPRDRQTARLGPAFDALIAATRANGLPVPDWMSNWQLMPEFLLTSIYLDRFTIDTLGPAYDAAITRQGGGVSLRLRADAKGGPRTLLGLDSLKTLRLQFCAASASVRHDVLVDKVDKTAALVRLKLADPGYASLNGLTATLGRVLAAQLACVDRATPCSIDTSSADVRQLQQAGWMSAFSAGTVELMLRQRTRAWLPQIVRAVGTHRRTFVIVGALHLPDLRVGDRVEPGLVTQLRGQGFTVTPIASAADIAKTFLAPTWSERLRATLGRL
ncbi:TraB/GumN family protein [Pseudoduganella chitinolytica]|uniref:TraB/GumN family protein n=1 Tax=Pseudoduganella chitinolytica TaxID=34070 RepID=A0ABY8B825_9BURK|nr:TraB/GumN family protein [Pseudoduganella chitinolytica]WEF31568.1 TraB/GumN family protein [Pseudoduganella chitinolytica]